MPEDITSFETPTYRFLSNFYSSPIMVLGHTYATVEHAYQAWKATNPEDAELIREASTPGKAKKLGQLIPKRSDWDDIKVDVMTTLIRLKFQNRTLAKWLVDTGEAKLVEGNTWGDEFWGVCRGRGWNKLGSILMHVRAELAHVTVARMSPEERVDFRKTLDEPSLLRACLHRLADLKCPHCARAIKTELESL